MTGAGEIFECILNDNQSAAQLQSLVGFNQLFRSDTGDHCGLVMTGWSRPPSPLHYARVDWLDSSQLRQGCRPRVPRTADIDYYEPGAWLGWGPTQPGPGGKLPDIRHNEKEDRAQTPTPAQSWPGIAQLSAIRTISFVFRTLPQFLIIPVCMR